MARSKTNYSAEFKTSIVLEAIREDKTIVQIAAEKKVDPKSIRDWKKEFLENSSIIFDRKKEIIPYKDKISEKDREIDELYKQIGQLTVEVNWAKKKLESVDYKTRMKMIEKESEIALNKQCSMLAINRSSLYYRKVEKEENIDIKSKILDIYENKPFYGYRRVEKELKNKGYEIGKKKVIRLRQELKIKTIYPKKKTTIIRKEDKKYPYLLLGLEINQPNTVWSIDITYIKVESSYCYLAAIIDWYSRKILSYRISNTMEVDFCIEALEEALKKYGKPDVFNSDQGSQFTSEKFTKKLKENKIKISMDGKGRWADNVIIERFFRTLKYENIFLKRYENMMELKKGVKEFIYFYNNDRLHSSLNYETPNSVYFEENKSKIKPIYKMDKESLVKCLFWMFIYNKNSGKKTVDKTAA